MAGAMAKACDSAYTGFASHNAADMQSATVKLPGKQSMPCSQPGSVCNDGMSCMAMTGLLSAGFVFDRVARDTKQPILYTGSVWSVSPQLVLRPPII